MDVGTWQLLPSFLDQLDIALKKNDPHAVLYLSFSMYDRRIPYELLEKHVDALIVNAYPNLSQANSPKPLSSVPELLLSLSNIVQKVDADKLVVMLPTFAYDWSPDSLYPTKHSRQSVISILRSGSTIITYDDVSLNPYLQYLDDYSLTHQLWYSDATTFFNQVSL